VFTATTNYVNGGSPFPVPYLVVDSGPTINAAIAAARITYSEIVLSGPMATSQTITIYAECGIRTVGECCMVPCGSVVNCFAVANQQFGSFISEGAGNYPTGQTTYLLPSVALFTNGTALLLNDTSPGTVYWKGYIPSIRQCAFGITVLAQTNGASAVFDCIIEFLVIDSCSTGILVQNAGGYNDAIQGVTFKGNIIVACTNAIYFLSLGCSSSAPFTCPVNGGSVTISLTSNYNGKVNDLVVVDNGAAPELGFTGIVTAIGTHTVTVRAAPLSASIAAAHLPLQAYSVSNNALFQGTTGGSTSMATGTTVVPYNGQTGANKFEIDVINGNKASNGILFQGGYWESSHSFKVAESFGSFSGSGSIIRSVGGRTGECNFELAVYPVAAVGTISYTEYQAATTYITNLANGNRITNLSMSTTPLQNNVAVIGGPGGTTALASFNAGVPLFANRLSIFLQVPALPAYGSQVFWIGSPLTVGNSPPIFNISFGGNSSAYNVALVSVLVDATTSNYPNIIELQVFNPTANAYSGTVNIVGILEVGR